VIGIGLETKYTMAFYAIAIAAAVVLTPARRYLGSKYLWYGAALAVVIFLPNLIWQFRHDFVSLHFLQHIHARDVGEGRAENFLRYQYIVNTNRWVTPLWLAGVFFFFFAPSGRRYTFLGWLYIIPLAIFWLAKGRFYYVSGAYPMLFAGGAVIWQQCFDWLRAMWARVVYVGATFAAVAYGGLIAAMVILPLYPLDSPKNVAIKENGDLREEVGWTELVAEVARIRDSLPPEQRASLGIITGNYGETGAINLFGPNYGLPQAISGTNSAWYRSYPNPPPQTLIVLGWSQKSAEGDFQGCRVAGHNGNPYGLHNEEADDHPDIFVCGPPKEPWPEFWKDFQWFG
jgi:hypothetical protein